MVKSKKTLSRKLSHKKSLKNKRGGSYLELKNPTEPKLSSDCMNPKGLSQLGLNTVNLSETASEQAFANRYKWSGAEPNTNGLSSNNHINNVEQSGGKQRNSKKKQTNNKRNNKKQTNNKKRKNNKNKQQRRKKSGGGYYLSLEQPKIAGQSVVSGYENCVSDPKF